jgi:hypothetical protein
MSEFENGAPSVRQKMMLGWICHSRREICGAQEIKKTSFVTPGGTRACNASRSYSDVASQEAAQVLAGGHGPSSLFYVDGVSIGPMVVLHRFENQQQRASFG